MNAMAVSGYIRIAECDGGVEVVERELYDRIYKEAAAALESGGSAAALALRESARQAETQPVRAAILLTVVEALPEGVRLRTADEVDYYRKQVGS